MNKFSLPSFMSPPTQYKNGKIKSTIGFFLFVVSIIAVSAIFVGCSIAQQAAKGANEAARKATEKEAEQIGKVFERRPDRLVDVVGYNPSKYPCTSGSIVDCMGPSDFNGRNWYDADYDDSHWLPIPLPDNGWGPENSDRYYRDKIILPTGIDTVMLQFWSDDGIWIYINGVFLGKWGGPCHTQGCVNLGCFVSTTIPAQDISSLTRVGNNTLCFHVSNALNTGRFSYKLFVYVR